MAASKNILMLVGDFAEDYELMVPFQALKMLGYEVHSVCPGKKKGDKVATAVHDFVPEYQTYLERQGHNFDVNYDFSEVKSSNYIGLYIPGGRAPEYLRLNEKILEIIREFYSAKKPIAVICHGAQLLTAAGCVKGHRVCPYPALKSDIEISGGVYVPNNSSHDNVEVDGNLISSPACK
jgi:protease I